MLGSLSDDKRSAAVLWPAAAAFAFLLSLTLMGCGTPASPRRASGPVSRSYGPTSTPTAGAYLGQQLPGADPEYFAASIIKGDLHTPPVFTPDGVEAYWSLQDNTIMTSVLEEGGWTQPTSAVFSASMTDYRDPFITPSGDRLFFLSKGKLPGSKLPERENIWLVQRSGDGWGEPRPLSETVNAHTFHWQISVAANGNLYFASSEPDGLGDMYVARNRDGEYDVPVKLAAPVNSAQVELTPYVAPDESYLLFARMTDQDGDPRLYISFSDKKGSWGEPHVVEGVTYGLCPSVSPDGSVMFYLSSPNSVSWMNTDFIDDLRLER